MYNLASFLELFKEISGLLLQWGWQSICLVAIVFLIAKMLKSRAAEIRHKVWLICLIGISLLPFLSLVSWLIPIRQLETAAHFGNLPSSLMLMAGGLNSAATEQINFDLLGWLSVGALSVWFTGFFVYVVRFCLMRRNILRIVSKAEPVNTALYTDQLQLPENLTILSTPEVSNPILAGFSKPIILFPTGLDEWTTETERVAIIRHELAHLERGDHYIQIFQVLIEAVFFFHPAVRYVLNQMNFERELACDESVINSGTSVTGYTETLLKVAERAIGYNESRHQLAFIPKKQLSRRINKIMHLRGKPMSKKLRALLLAKTAILLAIVAWFVMPNHSDAQHVAPHHFPMGKTAAKSPAADEQTTEAFKNLYQGIKDAIMNGDRDAFGAFFADDYRATVPNGMTLTKEQVVNTHIQKPTPNMKLEKVEFTDLKVQKSGNTVIVTYLAEMGGVHNGVQVNHSVRLMDVWEKKGDKWQSIASHVSHDTK